MTVEGYRKSHSREGYGNYYEKLFASGYYAAQWRDIEKPLIKGLFSSIKGANRSCLDFACGTARISTVASEYFGKVIGVDVSQAMLAAAQVPANVELRHIDITREHLNERFDVATAFRFFLNAEDSLRREALNAIHSHLNIGGRLICNIHMTPNSPTGFAYRIASHIPAARRFNGGDQFYTLSIEEFVPYLTEASFLVVEVIPYGYLPYFGALLSKYSESLVRPVENIARKWNISASHAQNFIVVALKQ